MELLHRLHERDPFNFWLFGFGVLIAGVAIVVVSLEHVSAWHTRELAAAQDAREADLKREQQRLEHQKPISPGEWRRATDGKVYWYPQGTR